MSKINIGGQAVIEGVMMRAPRSIAIAVRRPNGEIVVRKDMVVPLSERFPIVKLPVVRGAVALFSSLVTGIKALNFSANEALAEEEKKEDGKNDLSSWALAGTMVVAFAFGILLFFLLPLYATKLLTQMSLISDNNIVFNLVDGVIRVAVFLLYIWSISMMKDIQRVFQYHGAEHKSIFAFEAGDELTVANVRRYSRLHPRCGTSFLLIVMLGSFVVFSVLDTVLAMVFGGLTVAIRIPAHLLALPVVAGASYELIRFAATHADNRAAQWLTAPGLWLQRITTQEPEIDQLEIAAIALTAALGNAADTPLAEAAVHTTTVQPS